MGKTPPEDLCIACDGEQKFCAECGDPPSRCECASLEDAEFFPCYVVCDLCVNIPNLEDEEE